MRATMTYMDRLVAAPIVEEGRKLSHSLEDYFPHKSPELWFAWDEATQNRWIVQRLNGACPIFGYPEIDTSERVEAHHEYRKGSGGKDIAKVPWAIVPALKSLNSQRSAHDLYHTYNLEGRGFEVVHWDWLDEEAGFEVLDENSESILHDKLFFYTRATPGRVKEAMEWKSLMLMTLTQMIKLQYDCITLAAAGGGHAPMLGYKNVLDFISQHGVMNGLIKKGIKVFDIAHPIWKELIEKAVAVPMVELTQRKTKGESAEVKDLWTQNLFGYCSPTAEQPSIADFITNITLAFPAKARLKKATVITGENLHAEQKEVYDIGELFGSGLVMKGWPLDEPVEDGGGVEF